MILAARRNNGEEVGRLTKFSAVSFISLGLIALSTLVGYGHITVYAESNASGTFKVLSSLLVLAALVGSGFLLDLIKEKRDLEGSVGAMLIYGVFIITLPKNLYIQALFLYAGLCLSAYLVVKSIDYWVEKKAKKEELVAEKT